MALRNIDDLLVKDNQERMEGVTPGSTEPFTPKQLEETESPDNQPETIDSKPESEPESKVDQEIKEEKTEPTKSVETSSKSVDDNKDEYGNEVIKTEAKMYSEEEVQNMIRDRLSRGRYAQQQQQQPYQQPQQPSQQEQSFQHDPNSEVSWEQQLEEFVNVTISKREQHQQNAAWQQREQQVQAEFEGKFSHGMSKYKDFTSVVAGKPITDTMMLATRGMSDPAAFLYSAAKNHSGELERIAKIQDPYQQGAEIGKLEERMRKAVAVSRASKPLPKTVGDSTGRKQEVRDTIDSRIQQHAKGKFRR